MAKIRNGDSYLETHLSANDYYCEKESIAGIWIGRGAEFLRIHGNKIDSKDKNFERLRNNQHPLTGEKLTKRNKTTRLPSFNEARKSLCQKLRLKGALKEGSLPSNKEIESYRSKMKPLCNRIAFYDFQCGCAKSVSIMATVGGDSRLRHAHEEAVAVALKELEQLAARRVDFMGKKQIQFTGNFAAAIFQHDSSRALDPQLHTHCVIANATFDEASKEWFGLTEFEMLKAIRYGGKVYQNELAKRVQELGYGIVERRNEKGFIEGFEIEGVSLEIMKRFSKRRAVIKKKIEEFKIKTGRLPSSAEISVLTRESRESKDLKKISTAEVRSQQLAQLSEMEQKMLFELKEGALKVAEEKVKIDELKIASIASIKVEDISEVTIKLDDNKESLAIQDAMKHVFERNSALQSHQILAEALNQNIGSIDVESLKNILKKSDFGNEGTDKVGLVELVNDSNHLASIFTSAKHLEHESWAVNFVNASMGKRPKLLTEEPVTSEWLAKEQADAVKFICGNKDAVCAIRGIAGAGKTTMLKELYVHLEKFAQKMLYLAPTASAVKVLSAEGFEHAMTVSEYLVKATSKPWHNALIVIDEAGLQSTKQGYEVLKLAQKNWQKVVLVGDSKQHVSVEAGDFLRLLETHSKMKSNELVEIRRQISREYRHTISLMAEGNAGEALEYFNKMGWINESGAQYLEDAAKNYLVKSEYGTKVDQVIAVAPTWSENFAFTEGIRNGFKEAGVLKDGVMMEVVDSFQWTQWQKKQVSGYREGLVVTVTKDIGELKKGAYLVKSVKMEVGCSSGEVLIRGSDKDYSLSLNHSKFFDVGKKRLLEVSKGDKILLRANDKKLGLVNGSVLTVYHVESNGLIMTREGLAIPQKYRHFTHGYVVTSHKSQGMTADHVVVAAAKLDEKAAYVATSRGRVSCDIHTPETDKLIVGTRQSSLRLGSMDAKGLEPSLMGFPMFSDEVIRQSHSPHPMRKQSLRVIAFGDKIFNKLMTTLEITKKVKASSWEILSAAMRTKVWKESIGKVMIAENRHNFKITF